MLFFFLFINVFRGREYNATAIKFVRKVSFTAALPQIMLDIKAKLLLVKASSFTVGQVNELTNRKNSKSLLNWVIQHLDTLQIIHLKLY